MRSYPSNVVWAPQPGSQEAFLASSPIFEVLYQGTRGGGKSIADDTLVMTERRGWQRADAVTMNDRLLDLEGKWVDILGIFPQPLQPMVRLWFRDTKGRKTARGKAPKQTGRCNTAVTSVVCSLDHKWRAKSTAYRGWQVVTTKQMCEDTTTQAARYSVPSMIKHDPYLHHWEEHPPTPHRCFSVDSPSHCFMIVNGLMTHNTDCLLMSFAMHTGKGFESDWRGVLFRRTYKELGDVIQKSKKWFSQIFPQAAFNHSEHVWTFPEGEQLLLRQFKNPDDYWNYHGHAYPWIGWEELCSWPTDEGYRRMFSCSRSTTKGMPRMVRATTNPYGCVPYGEVLTATRGWVDIKDVRKGESVLSVTRDLRLTEAVVEEVLSHDYDGLMISREGSGLSMRFTEDHRLPVVRRGQGFHRLSEFRELPKQASIARTATSWDGEKLEDFQLPEVSWMRSHLKNPVPTKVEAEDFANLVGWLVSEGSFHERGFKIAQKKTDNRERIKFLLDKIGFSYTEDASGYRVSSTRWGVWCCKNLGQNSICKRIPEFLLRAESRILRILFTSAMDGDGSWKVRPDVGVYHTQSRKLADQMMEIGVKLGYSVRESSHLPALITVSFSHRNLIQLNQKNVSKEYFQGKVFCLRVPETETFFIRQNGCVWLSGNSGHNWVKHRFNPSTMNMEVRKGLIDEEGRPEPPRLSIFSDIRENKILLEADPGYIDRIAASARNKAEKAAWLDGSWDIVAGGMFDDVWDADHNFIPPFPIPGNWRITRSFDWGSSKPFSVGWWAISTGEDYRDGTGKVRSSVRGDVFRVNEWYGWTGKPNEGLRMLASDISRGIVEREVRWGWRDPRNPTWCRVRPGPADSQIFAAENGNCIATDMKTRVRLDSGIEYPGIQWLPADKRAGSRVTGWDQLRRALKNAHPGPNGPRERPGLFVFQNCEHFARTIPVLPRDSKDQDDVDTEAEDHVGDDARYLIRSLGSFASSGRTVGSH